MTRWQKAVSGMYDPPADDRGGRRTGLARRVGHLWLTRLLRRAARLKTRKLKRRAKGMAERLQVHLDADILMAEGNLDGYLQRLSGKVEVQR